MKLEIFDSIGNKVQIGDLVQIQDKRNFHEGGLGLTFWAKVQIIEGKIYPFNKFVFDRIIKIDKIPENIEIIHFPEIKGEMSEYWISKDAHLYLVNTLILRRWRIDCLELLNNLNNQFYKISIPILNRRKRKPKAKHKNSDFFLQKESDDPIARKLKDWEENYSNDISWEEFKNYGFCERCKSYLKPDEVSCICYAR